MRASESEIAKYMMDLPPQYPESGRFLYRVGLGGFPFRHVSNQGSQVEFTRVNEGKEEHRLFPCVSLTPVPQRVRLDKGILYAVALGLEIPAIKFQVGSRVFNLTMRRIELWDTVVEFRLGDTDKISPRLEWICSLNQEALHSDSVYPIGRVSTPLTLKHDVFRDSALRVIEEVIRGDNGVSRYHGFLVPSFGEGSSPVIYMLDTSTHGIALRSEAV